MFNEEGEFDRALFRRGEHPLERPGAMALSENGRTIYVADPPRNVIVELNREGEVNGTIALTPELAGVSALSVIDNQIYVLGGREHRVESFSPDGRCAESCAGTASSFRRLLLLTGSAAILLSPIPAG